MLVKEIHIAIEQGVQKLASHQTRNLGSNIIDLLYNKEKADLIEQVINPVDRKDMSTQERADILRNLLVQNKTIPAYVPDTTSSFYSSNMVYGILPANYAKLESDLSTVHYKCSPITGLTTKKSLTHRVNIYYPAAVTAPYYSKSTMQITKNNVTNYIFNSSQFPSIDGGVSKSDAKFIIVNRILEDAWKRGYQVYWERYGNEYIDNTFIIIDTASFKIDFNGNVYTSTSSVIEQYDVSKIKGLKKATVNNRLHIDDVRRVLAFPYSKTEHKSPVSTMMNGVLMAYHNKDFVITDFMINYYKVPRNISLEFDVNCELNERAQRLIIDRVVNNIIASIADPRYQVMKAEEMN